jgi:hypothetical protein
MAPSEFTSMVPLVMLDELALNSPPKDNIFVPGPKSIPSIVKE